MNEQTSVAADVETLLDRKQVAARWRCSEQTVKRRQADGSLPPVYLPGGRLIRYRLRDVLNAEGITT